MKISDEVYVHGYIDEIRNGTIIIRNEGGYFGTAPEEVMPSAQPEQHYDEWCTDCKEYDKERHCCPRWNKVIRQTLDEAQQSQWIPCSEPPEESGTYIVTAYDGAAKRVTFVKYQKTLKQWDLTGARSYWRILAYKPLPEAWRGES